MIKHSITLDPDTVKCLSNIPANYFMEIGSTAQISYRFAGTSHDLNCSKVVANIKLKYLTKRGSCRLGLKAEPERIGTAMDSLEKSVINYKGEKWNIL